LTHGCLVVLTAALFVLLINVPLWIAFLPCAIIQHRIGVLLHEYIHGIPFRRYRNNLLVLSAYEGLLLTFGFAELFRGTHLAHHRWLNTERDPAFTAEQQNLATKWGRIATLEAVQHVIYLFDVLRGRHPYVVRSRIALGLCLSLVALVGWGAAGLSFVARDLVILTIFITLGPVSLRGAVEHHSHPEDLAFANEYRVLVPLFNLNKHVHHHLEPRRPWYLLEYQTARPLWTLHYFTHWFRAHLTREFVLMKPAPKRDS
jgi:fatty acid desaturase